LLESCERHGTALCFGVLRRKEVGKGTNDDVLPGNALWVDIDFKDFAVGETEARELLKSFSLPPSIVVRSGHGLHLYWILREPAEPGDLSSYCERLERVLRGDHTHDPARVLRLPGSINRKDPASPKHVEFEVFEPERAYNLSEIDEALELGDDGDRSCFDDEPDSEDGKPPSPLPARVLARIQQSRRIGMLFNGNGKPELGPDGAVLDRSSSGYDFSLAIALAKAGIRDEAELALALQHRPDGAARSKGAKYARRTVRKALELVEVTEAEVVECQVDFVVDKIRTFNSNPARYEFTIAGRTFTVSSPQLRSPAQFAIAYMDAIHRVPTVPRKVDEWAPIVNGWLTDAEIVDMPPDASREPRFVEAIEKVIADMPVGDAAEDLDHGKGILLPSGARAFKAVSLVRRLRDDWTDVEPGDVSRVLKSQGYASGTVTFTGKSVRVWSRADNAK
jgi:hypothetical protein